MININAQIIFLELLKLTAIKSVFHIPYQCAIMSEVTTLRGSNCNRLLRILFHNDFL